MTERIVVKQSKVDDDAISLTSTLASEYGPDDEFSVDRILADKTEGNKRKYLILWEGYPLEKATWEPHKNINDEILEVWKERKSRESKGLDPPFDVAEFDALLARLAAEKADRRRRRKAKRKRLGMAVSPAPSEADDSDSSIEAIEENEVEDVKPGAKRKSKSPPKRPAKALKPLNGRRGSTSSLASLDTARTAPEKKASGMFRPSPDKLQPPSRQASEGSRHSRTLSQSSSDTPLSRKRPLQRPSVDRPGSSSSDGPLALKRSKPSAAAPAKSDVWKLTSAKKSTSSTEPTTLARGLHSTRGAYTVARGRVATRGGGNVAHKNVFQAREPPKQRGNLLKNARDAAKVPKKFTNMRLHRKAELQARDLAEGAPDISALGGLFDPSRPDSMVPIRPEDLRKASSNMVSLEEPNPLFVNSRENSPVADDPWSTKSHQPQPPVQIPPALRGMSTCHYWDKQQKDSNQPPCQMGTACKFLHRYVAGLPIAPAPNSLGVDPRRTDTSGSDDTWSNPQTAPIERKFPAGPAQSTCFFWDRKMKDRTEPECSRGDACTYQHRYEEGMPIAPPPPGWVGDIRRPNTLDGGQRAHGHPQAPSTEDFPPWPQDSSENHPQDTTHPPPRQRSSGDITQARSAYEDVSSQIPDLNIVLQRLRTTADSPIDPTRGSRPEPPLREVLTPVGEAPSRPAWDPYNPHHAICYFYFNNGSCSKDRRCKFIHSLEPSLPVAPSVHEQTKIFAKTPCLDFQKGFCKYASTSECKYSHPIEPTENITRATVNPPRQEGASHTVSRVNSVSELASKAASEPQTTTNNSTSSTRGPATEYFHAIAPSTPKSQTRPSWNPSDPTNSICYFWHTTGKCIKGDNCPYGHNNDPNLALAPSPKEQATIRSTALHEFRKAESSLIREDLSSSRQSSGPRVIPVREEVDKAAIEGQIATGSSRDSARKPPAPSPLPATTTTPPKSKPRPAWNPRDPLNAICFFLASAGACPEERGCQYIHSNDPNLAVAPSPLEITGRPAWKPRNPLNAICYFLASTGSCSQGSRCKFFHSNDPTLPIAPSPSLNETMGPPEYDDRGRQTCRYWLRDDCKYSNNTCRFWHGPLSAKEQYDIAREQASSPTKPTPTGPRVKSVSFAIDEDMPLVEEPEGMSSSNQRLEKPRPQLRSSEAGSRYPDITCPYWTKGYCQRGSSCWYRHANAVDEPSSRHVQDVQMKDTHIPARRIESSRDVEMKDVDEAARPAIPRKPSVRFDPMTNDRSLAMSESENLPSNPTEVQIASQPKNQPFEPPPELPNPSSDTTAPAPKAKQKIKMDDYRRMKAFNELGDRAKEVTFGIDETQSLMLDFGDMNQVLELPWGRSFTSVTKVRFDQMCIAQDFQAQQGLLQRLGLWHGNLLPADTSDPEAVKSIDKAADELVRKSAGLFSSFPNFLALVFPAKKDEWKFLETTLDYPQDARARLRYFIFQSDVDIRQSLKMNPTSLAIGSPYRDILVDRVHGLDFKKLLPIAKKSRPPNFYLLFPSTASQSAEFIISWLRSKRTCKIYSSQIEGSWNYFTHTPEIDNGIILVHESAAAELYRLPNLYSIVVEKRFTFWYLSESNSPYPLFPSTFYDFDDSTMGQLNAIRLFPHGCAFLLTPSFLVAEPHNAYQILNWFILGGGKPKYLSSTPRTWKLVCCYNFADYVLELANSKATEKDAFELKYQNDPAKDAKLYDAGLSFNECNLRYKLHKLLVDFESRRSLESISEFDSDCDESDYPFIHANKHIDPDDEKGLVDWYAAWTMRNLDMYMKFIVVGSSEPKHRERLVRMKETEVVRGKKRVAAAESPRLPKQMTLAVTAKLLASPGNNGSKERELEHNPFDDIAVKAATSPRPEVWTTGDGINLDEQIDELIAESSKSSPGLDIANKGTVSHTNGSASTNPLPISGSTSHPHLQSPPQFNGTGDQSVDMDLDSPMLGFGGAGDERPTSSSSNTPRSGIESDENGRRFVPRSARQDASVRKEITVRPGYVPPEDGDFYQIPSRRGSAAGTPMGQSAVPSPAVGGSSAMGVDSDSADGAEAGSGDERARGKTRWMSAESVEDGEVEEVVTEKKVEEVKFEATTTWYKNVVKEGRGWEHIRVEGWEGASRSLGVGK